VSSRVPGRIASIEAYEGDAVAADAVLVKVESRQAGDPPPVLSLRAPISGLVGTSHIRVGEPVEPDRELLDVLDLSRVWAVARVPEHYAGSLENGRTRARIRVPATGGEAFEGTLLRLGTEADRESGTIDAIFEIDNSRQRMRPGMRAEFAIVTAEHANVISVPAGALQGPPERRVVYVKDYDLPNAFVRVPVQTGLRNEESVEILSGLFPGDEVVTQGAYLLGFAGGGGVSLKEALDAAHGHEHNADGSEISGGSAGGHSEKDGHHHKEEAGVFGGINRFLAISCGVLLVLLMLSLFVRRKGGA